MPSVYDFLGYSLTKAKIIRDLGRENKYISISILRDAIDKKRRLYTMVIKVSLDLSEEESYFIFQAAFLINDLRWFNSISPEVRKSLFFGGAFPFIREKIFSITSDNNPGIFIPIMDLRNINWENEFKLIKVNK